MTGERASLGREKKLVDTGAGFFIEEDEEVESGILFKKKP